MKPDDKRLTPEDIRRIRVKLGLTQEQAGERIGGGRRAFSKYESGAVQPSAAVENLLRIYEEHPEVVNLDGGLAHRRLPATAQSPFEISADDLRSLSGAQFAELLRRLLHAEALTNGLPEDGIHVASNITAPDGGEDARIEWEGGVGRTSFLPSRLCQFQMKAGPITPAKAGREVTRRGEVKPMIRSVIEAGSNYIMLSSHPYVRKEIEARERKIRDAMRGSGHSIKDDQVEFRSGEQIAAWVNSQPSIALWLLERVRPGSVGTFTTYDGWRRHQENLAVSFANDARLPELKERIRACATVPGNTLRVVGLSGVGKSRLVFEAFGGEAEETLVMYAVESESPAGAVQSTVNRLADSQRRAVVVVDECDVKSHRQFMGMVSRLGSRLSLVTIDDELPRNVSDDATVEVSDSPVEVVESIVEALLPGIPNDDKRRLIRFAKGFPEIAVRIAGIWGKGVPIAHSTYDLVDSFVFGNSQLDRDLLLKSAQLVSAFGLVGWKPPIDTQITEIAVLDSVLTKPKLRQGITDLLNRGIIRARGRYVSLQPKPIAMNLAERQWQEWDTDQWDEALAGLTNRDLKVFAARQLAMINTTDVAKDVAKHVCRLSGPLNSYKSLSSAGHAEVVSSLAEIDRDAVATLIEHVTSMVGDLEKVTGDVRRNLVVAAEKIAFHPDSFDSGADLLLELAAHENESWANNATRTFNGLFTLYLGGTAADATARLRYLDHAIGAADDARLKILVAALSAGVRLRHFTRMSGVESHGSLEALTSWQPRTNEDILKYTSGFIARLADLGIKDGEVGTLAREELGGHFRALVNSGFIDSIEEVTTRFIEEVGYWPEGLRGANSALKYGDDLPDDLRKRVENMALALQSTGLESRVDLLVTKGITLQRDETDRTDFTAQHRADVRAVSDLFNELNANVDVMRSCLPSLVRGTQHMAYEFGRSLGESSDDPLEWLQAIIEPMKETEPQEVNHDLLVGYLKGLHAEHPSEVAMIKKLLAGSEFFAPAFTMLCPRLGEISHTDLEIALDALDAGHLRPHHLRPWAFGGVLADTPVVHVAPLFDALIDHSAQGMAECADLMGMYVWGAPEKLGDLRDQIVKLAKRSVGWEDQYGRGMDNYHFQELMKTALNRGRNDGLARSTALELAKSFVMVDGYRSHGLFEPILPSLLSEFTEIVWPIIGQAIVDDEMAAALLMFELGGGMSFSDEPDSAILNLPEDVLFAWCYANPEKAPAFAARNLPFLTTLDRSASEREIHPRMRRLIDEFGNREDVREEISANIHTFGWSGSTTEYYEMFYEPMAGLTNHKFRDVRRWATQVSNQLRDAFERAKNEDEEMEARSEFY